MTWQPYDSCPCGCGVIGWKQTKPLRDDDGPRHVVGCKCRPHLGKRSQKQGKAAQAKMHRNLGGTGFTPSNEESARPYTIEVTVMPESKVGGQVPANFDTFIGTDWFRRALAQSTKAVPVGSGALPAVVIRGDWCVVDIRGRA